MTERSIYPTGGYTEFEFEPHYYRKQLRLNRWEGCDSLISNQLAGGLRIKNIKNSPTTDGTSQILKEYYYVSDYLPNGTNASVSSGVLGGRVQYFFDNYIVYAFNDRDVKRKMSAFSSISVLPSCQNTLGSHIGYTEVIEKRPDNSFTKYQFTNFDNGYMDEPVDAIIQLSRTPYEPYASKAKDRGNLILSQDYDANGMKVKSKSISYEKDAASNNYVRTMNACYKNVCLGTAVSYDEGTAYKIYTYLLRPISETETFYNPGNGNAWQAVTTGYTYTDRKLLRSTATANSNEAIHKTEYKYPFDISGNSAFKQMTDNNILSPIVEQTEYRNNQFTQKKITEYKNWGNNLFAPEFVKMQTRNSNLETRVTYHKYDSRGNPLYITKDDTDKVVYLWGYNHQYPIAEIRNADYSQIEQILTSTFINRVDSAAAPAPSDLTQLNNLRSNPNLQRAEITTYEYKRLVGMTKQTSPQGVVTTYEYDAFGRLQTVKDHNGNQLEGYDYHYKNP
jgi:YD repeat-containing protein